MGEKPTEADEAARSNLNSSKSNLAREGQPADAPAEIAVDEPGVTTNIAVSDPGSPADKK